MRFSLDALGAQRSRSLLDARPDADAGLVRVPDMLLHGKSQLNCLSASRQRRCEQFTTSDVIAVVGTVHLARPHNAIVTNYPASNSGRVLDSERPGLIKSWNCVVLVFLAAF